MSHMLFLILGAMLTLGGVAAYRSLMTFRAQRPAEFAGKGPLFDPRQHLNGPILCEGVIYGPTGRVASRFIADMQGTWSGNTGTLAETFRYDSGRVQNRSWTMTLGLDGGMTAEASDIIGTGRGEVSGPTVRMAYSIRLDPEAGGHVLDVIDWMYLLDNGTIVNRSQFMKFGVTVAELVATLRRVDPAGGKGFGHVPGAANAGKAPA